jgi:hypothetical protein
MIENLVFQCMSEHKGGEKFFDALDRQIAETSELYELLLQKSTHFLPNNSTTFIVSGKFGKIYGEWLIEKGFDCVVLEGSLRFNEIQNIEQYRNKIEHKLCVFIDDSYFAGRTYRKVRDMVIELHGCTMGCVVAYDGSKEYSSDVLSLFRYYDYFGEEKGE